MNLWKECSELNEKGISFVVVTMTSVLGSSPQDPGAKILVTKNGLYGAVYSAYREAPPVDLLTTSALARVPLSPASVNSHSNPCVVIIQTHWRQ